jgi:hypothetical protein
METSYEEEPKSIQDLNESGSDSANRASRLARPTARQGRGSAGTKHRVLAGSRLHESGGQTLQAPLVASSRGFMSGQVWDQLADGMRGLGLVSV